MTARLYHDLDDTVYFWFAANDTSGSGGDGATPAADVRLAGAAASAAPVYSPTPVLLTDAGYPAGCYELAIAATGANGFATGNTYAVFCTLAIDSQNPTGFIGSFNLDNPVQCDVRTWITADVNALSSGRVDANVTAMAAGVIDSTVINNDAITGAKIATGAIGATEIAVGAIEADAFAAGAINAAAIATGAIDADAIAADAIGSSELAANAINSTVVSDGTITAAKISAAAIGATQIASDAITFQKIATDAIGSSELAASAIDEIVDAVWDELATGHTDAGKAGQQLWTDIDAIETDTQNIQSRLPAALVGGAMDSDVSAIQANTITAASIATDAVDADALAADAANEIADAVLSRDVDQVEATMALHSLGTAILKTVSRIRENAGTLETYRTNGTTLHMSQTVTTDASADPVDELTAGV